MRVPIEWLHEFIEPQLTAAELDERLTMTGTKVEAIHHHGVRALEHFVVGRVTEASPHPDADRLSLCRVDIGADADAQIVCGAPNVRAGQTVAVATPGAIMPDGTTLKAAELRGLQSQGMILAEDELAIGTDHAGIMVLDQDGLQPGTRLETVLPLGTDVLELEITPNRPDCLGIYGVAREVHAATGAPLRPPPWLEDPGTPGPVDGIEIEVECPELCPRFTARVFEHVEIKPSPPWLKARLIAAGQRPISNVVDITNYAMLMTAQPLHAFDLDRVAGPRLTVRRARPGEQVLTLDDQKRTLDEQMVLIADEQGPTSIAGVMGGARSEVQATTTRVLMEVANWNGPNIHRTSQLLGLRSEASGRFEKQLQPEQAMEAQIVATRLMLELTGATLRPGTVDVGGPGPEPVTLRLRDARVSGLLGAPISRPRCQEILTALEFQTTDAPDGLDVKPPPFRRADITREADVIEEVARIDGMEKLPATLPSRHGAAGRLTPRQRLRRAAADALSAQGVHEIVGWSFVSPDLSERLRMPPRDAFELENPMSADQSHLRTTLLGSLLDAARRNRAHGAATIRLFESGPVYLPGVGEPHCLGALLIGAVRPPTWREPAPRPADFFAAKGAMAGVLDRLRVPWTVKPASAPFVHPGRAASVEVGGERAGWLGEIHPLVAARWDLEQTVAAFELDLDVVAAHAEAITLYADVTSFPDVREDLAVVLPAATTAAEVLAVVGRAAGALLAHAEVFDVYRGEQVGEGNVSLALRLTFRAPDRTLTDAEVAERRAEIGAALAQELAGRVRDA